MTEKRGGAPTVNPWHDVARLVHPAPVGQTRSAGPEGQPAEDLAVVTERREHWWNKVREAFGRARETDSHPMHASEAVVAFSTNRIAALALAWDPSVRNRMFSPMKQDRLRPLYEQVVLQLETLARRPNRQHVEITDELPSSMLLLSVLAGMPPDAIEDAVRLARHGAVPFGDRNTVLAGTYGKYPSRWVLETQRNLTNHAARLAASQLLSHTPLEVSRAETTTHLWIMSMRQIDVVLCDEVDRETTDDILRTADNMQALLFSFDRSSQVSEFQLVKMLAKVAELDKRFVNDVRRHEQYPIAQKISGIWGEATLLDDVNHPVEPDATTLRPPAPDLAPPAVEQEPPGAPPLQL